MLIKVSMRLFCVLVITTVVIPLHLWAGEKVTAKGMSFFEEGKEVIAREKALDEAKRAAIQKVMGSYINSMTVVDNFQLHEDRIISHSSGYVKNVTVIDEKKSSLGTLEITIQAEVESADIKDDLQRFQDMLSWQRNPRISIVVQPGTAKKYLPAAIKAANILTGKLQQAGFKVLKFSEQTRNKVGLLMGLTLEQSMKTSDYQGMSISLNEIGLTADMFRPGDQEVLASSSAIRSIPGENSLLVLDKGARQCIDTIWKELKDKLLLQYEKELYNDRDIYLTLKNLKSQSRAIEIPEILKAGITGVKSCSLLLFDGKKGEYNLQFRGRPEHFINELEMSYFQNTGFQSKLETYTGNGIVLLMLN